MATTNQNRQAQVERLRIKRERLKAEMDKMEMRDILSSRFAMLKTEHHWLGELEQRLLAG